MPRNTPLLIKMYCSIVVLVTCKYCEFKTLILLLVITRRQIITRSQLFICGFVYISKYQTNFFSKLVISKIEN